MSIVTTATQPDHHALVMPDCYCGLCAPTWARRRGKSRRYSEPVTLVDALGREDAAIRPAMVEQHRERLTSMMAAADRAIAAVAPNDLGAPETGLPLVLFAAELAAAVQPDQFRGELPATLVAACEQAVTEATLTAADCLVGIVEAVQVLSAMV